MHEEIFKGEIVGCTAIEGPPKNREVTTFSVKSIEEKTREWRIHGKHEILLPGKKIVLIHNPNSTNPWAERYTLFNNQGNPEYRFKMPLDPRSFYEIE
ncbi:MAG: hypothetical protein KJ721_02755 [Nanoarchaeota archaeon]|nr:hypothetical protein [Nanoarchaeota archaeon]